MGFHASVGYVCKFTFLDLALDWGPHLGEVIASLRPGKIAGFVSLIARRTKCSLQLTPSFTRNFSSGIPSCALPSFHTRKPGELEI